MHPDPELSAEIQRFEEQYAENPDSLIFARLADLYRKAGDPDRALTILRRGLERHSDYLSAHIVRARCLRDMERNDEAESAFREVLDLDAQNLVALRCLGELARERGDLEEAERRYEELLQVDPRNDEARESLAELRGEEIAPPSEWEESAGEDVEGAAPAEGWSDESEGAWDEEAEEREEEETWSPEPSAWSQPEEEPAGEELAAGADEELPAESEEDVAAEPADRWGADWGEDAGDESETDREATAPDWDESWGAADEGEPEAEEPWAAEPEASMEPDEATEPEGAAEPEAEEEDRSDFWSDVFRFSREPITEEEPDEGEGVDDAEFAGPAARGEEGDVDREEAEFLGLEERSSGPGAEEEPDEWEEWDEPAAADADGTQAAELRDRIEALRAGRAEDADEADEDLLTETLARLYETQGLYEKAVEMYERLLRQRRDDADLQQRLERARSAMSGEAEAAGEADGVDTDAGVDAARPTDAAGTDAAPSMWADASGTEEAEERSEPLTGGATDGADESSVRDHLQALLRGEARMEGRGGDRGR